MSYNEVNCYGDVCTLSTYANATSNLQELDGCIFDLKDTSLTSKITVKARTVGVWEIASKPRARYIIEKITVLQPNKTMRVKISDQLEFHTPKDIICVVSEPDTFDMYWGCFIALSKFVHGDDITVEGIEYYAKKLSFDKLQIKEVNRAIKQYYKEIEAEKKAAEEEKQKKLQLAAKREKRAKKKRAKAERERQQRISEFAEGILLAEQMLSPNGQGH